jgi:iron complex transport system permease protein
MKEMKKNKQTMVLFILCLLIPIAFFISINAGYTSIDLKDIIRIITGGGTLKENLIIIEFRMPRIIIAMLVGAGFSLSGCILQGITKNPLADPGLMGINAGAGIVVIVFIMLSGTLSFTSIFALPIMSMIGAVITGTIIYKLSLQKNIGIRPISLVLNGVAIQAGINAVMTLIVIKLDESQHEFLVKWQAGSIWSSNWKFVIALFPWIILGFIVLMLMADKMDILIMGDEISTGLGIAVVKEKRRLLFTAIALAASSVAISGSISFVGLIAPHLSRKLVGAKHSVLIPTCAMVGALLVLAADTIARTIIEPSEIPTGIVVSILGSPYFLFLMLKNRKVSNNSNS